MKELIIRKAEIKDAEVIAEFNKKAARETEDMNLNFDVALGGTKAVINDPYKGFYLIAEIPETGIIGQLMVTFEWSDWRNKYFWWIQSVYVHKKYRKQKVFSRLHKQVIEMAKSIQNVCGVRLYVVKDNSTAKQVYEALDMQKTHYDIFELTI
jgi:GNAT superfamily N-acetyltransferase